MKYYLGIDGGGTRTVAAVSDENGKILIKQRGKTINFYSVGMETARRNLADIIDGINYALGITEFTAVFIGCSALDDEADKVLTDELCGGIINAGKIKMHSDVYIALESLGDAECPCVAICGTGSIAVARDRYGNMPVTGGWGHLVGDEGSAYAVAVSALKLCCRINDKNDMSPLLQTANSFFGVTNFRKAIDIIYSPETTKDVIASFAEKVGELALQGDAGATEIIRTEACLFADTVLTLLNRVECCTVLGLYGGVFQHNETFLCAFSEKIKISYPNLNVRLLDIPPEDSALVLARKM